MSRTAVTWLALLALCALRAAESKPCICTMEYAPVCFQGKTFGNACAARCAGITTWVDGECGSKCPCPKIRAPVCAKGRTFANSCIAKCNGYLKYTNGECVPPPIKCNAGSSTAKCPGDVCTASDSPCATNSQLSCVINPCSSATYLGTKLKKLQCKPIYVNKSTGKVERNCNKALPPLVCAPGSPQAKCKGDPCELTTATCKGDPRYVCLGNSCGELTYLGTKLTDAVCTAIFVDPLTRKVVPECIANPLPPPIKCDAGSSTAKCSGEVCTASDSPCASNSQLNCVINPCSSATYLGTKLKKLQCKPIYVNKATGKVEKNCNRPLPPLVCAPGSPTAKCKGDPCELTTASCKGDDRYVCLGNSCGELTYLGTKLTGAMCTAIFVDPLTRKVVPECIAQPRRK